MSDIDIKRYIEDLCKEVVKDKKVFEFTKKAAEERFESYLERRSITEFQYVSSWFLKLQQDCERWYWRNNDLMKLCAVLGEEYEKMYMRICEGD